MKKLSKAQQRVVDWLKEDKKRYVIASTYYHFQSVEDGVWDWNEFTNKHDGFKEYFHKSTFDSLVNLQILLPYVGVNASPRKYTLNNDLR